MSENQIRFGSKESAALGRSRRGKFASLPKAEAREKRLMRKAHRQVLQSLRDGLSPSQAIQRVGYDLPLFNKWMEENAKFARCALHILNGFKWEQQFNAVLASRVAPPRRRRSSLPKRTSRAQRIFRRAHRLRSPRSRPPRLVPGPSPETPRRTRRPQHCSLSLGGRGQG